MTSNFSFLSTEWAGFFDSANLAEQNAIVAPMYSGMLSRKSLEEFVRWMYDHDDDLKLPYDTTLNALIHEQSFKDNIPEGLFKEINLVRKTGNNAVHGAKKIRSDESVHAVRLLHHIISWVVTVYSQQKPVINAFDSSLIPTGKTVDKTKDQLQSLENQYQQSQEELKRKQSQLDEKSSMIEGLKKQLEQYKAIKQSNRTKIVFDDKLNEAQTRKYYINAMLEEAGWDPYEEGSYEVEMEGMPDGKTGFADYVLWGDDGLPLAVIEAKRTTLDPQQGQRQAELYANCLETKYGQRPIIFYTNGFKTWIWDDAQYAHRGVQGFYKKDELQLLINRRESKERLTNIKPNESIVDRYYQKGAIQRVVEAFEKKQRTALLVMSMGTGKTRTAAALVDVLVRANWVKRVLFIADRTALVTQAKKAFNRHLPNLAAIDLTRESEDESSRVVFTTYNTLMNRIDGERKEGTRFYGVGHFDLIILDEIHRSIYKKYRYVFEYFDAIKLGLTATPRDEMDRNTYEVLGLEDHNPTFGYELKDAVDDKYLRPPKAMAVPLKFPREGIKYKDLSPLEKEEYEEKFGNPETGEVPDEIDSSALNDWLFNAGTVDKVLEHLMTHGVKVEGGDKLGKTIIFSKSHKHALFIEKRFNALYPDMYSGHFLRIIDNYDKFAQTTIDDFSTPEKMPQIALSVDMLDTGIDIPEIVNLVFFKPVRSKIKFWQMVGRGTRLCPDLFGPGQDKDFFYIFDFCENLEFFDANPEGVEPRTSDSVSQRLFKKRIQLAANIQNNSNANEEQLNFAGHLLDMVFKQIRSLKRDSFMVQREIQFYDKYQVRGSWDFLNPTKIKEIEGHLSPLIMDEGADEGAKRFDSLILNAQSDLFQKRGEFVNYKINIQGIVRDLSRKGSIPMVAEKMLLLNELAKDSYWENITLTQLEGMRTELRELIKFLEKESIAAVYTKFEDQIVEVKEFDLVPTSTRLESYRLRVEKIIRENEHHVTIHRLRTNQPITPDELNELEKLLFEGDSTAKQKFKDAYGDKPLGVFIRSLLGMDINAAKEAFSEFISKGSLSGDQIKFIDTIINFFSVAGTLDKKMLFDKPFTEINDMGLTGVFDESSSVRILSIVDTINKNALAASQDRTA
jgi:type I restriction enzyme R subunit